MPFAGTRIYGTDVHPFSDLNFVSTCKSSLPPTCTAISTNELDWDLNHGKEHYITIRVNNTAGLMTRVSSKPYRYDILAPSAGIVIDIDPEALQGVSILFVDCKMCLVLFVTIMFAIFSCFFFFFFFFFLFFFCLFFCRKEKSNGGLVRIITERVPVRISMELRLDT